MGENDKKIIISFETDLVTVIPSSKNEGKRQKEIHDFCRLTAKLLTLVFKRPVLLKETIKLFERTIKRLETINFVEI